MRTLLSCALFAFLVCHASGQRAAFDPSQLVGKWEGFVSAGDGSNSSQRTANVTLTITADKITCSSPGSSGEGTYRVAPGTGNLHQIDGIGTGGTYRGKVYLGIFTLEGNTLKWCSTEGSRNRPTVLRTNSGARQYLMVLTRKP